MKRCSQCKEKFDTIYKQQKYCNSCRPIVGREQRYKWRKNNPKRAAIIKRKVNLKLYGLTLEQYDQMFEIQKGICVICGGINSDGRRLFVDHNHKTGKVRALLCNKCNSIIGYVKEDIKLLQKIIKYIKTNSISK